MRRSASYCSSPWSSSRAQRARADDAGERARTERRPDPGISPRYLESLARELVGAEATEWKRIVIVSGLCANAGSPDHADDYDDALTPDEQDELGRRLDGLAPRISFMEDPTPLYDEAGSPASRRRS